MQPLEELYEAPDLPAYDLPPTLAELYDGALGLVAQTVANFVSSLDGVVAIPSLVASPSVISGKSELTASSWGFYGHAPRPCWWGPHRQG